MVEPLRGCWMPRARAVGARDFHADPPNPLLPAVTICHICQTKWSRCLLKYLDVSSMKLDQSLLRFLKSSTMRAMHILARGFLRARPPFIA
jgi:hypothetical protein